MRSMYMRETVSECLWMCHQKRLSLFTESDFDNCLHQLLLFMVIEAKASSTSSRSLPYFIDDHRLCRHFPSNHLQEPLQGKWEEQKGIKEWKEGNDDDSTQEYDVSDDDETGSRAEHVLNCSWFYSNWFLFKRDRRLKESVYSVHKRDKEQGKTPCFSSTDDSWISMAL